MIKSVRLKGWEKQTIQSIKGTSTMLEIEALYGLASQVDVGKIIVEIGCGRGRSTCAIGYGSKSGNINPIYAIDNFSSDVGDRQEFYGNMYRSYMGDIVSLVGIDSMKAWRSGFAENIGLLYVDGSIDYSEVKCDVDNFLWHLSENAIVVFGNGVLEDGVAAAINEYKNLGVLEEVDVIDNMVVCRSLVYIGGAK